MVFRVRNQRIVHVYVLVFVTLGVLVALSAIAAYHVLLREQNFQIRAAVAKFTNGDFKNLQFGKYINLFYSFS